MNKYDFDFMRIEDILYDVLGIAIPDNIALLKKQIYEDLSSLSQAIDRKTAILSPNNPEKGAKQKEVLRRELDGIKDETDLDKILRKCITIRYTILLSLELKARSEDTYDEKIQKINKRKEVFAVSNLLRSVPSILEFIKDRRNLLRHIDSDNRIVDFKKTEDEIDLGIYKTTVPKGEPLQRLDLNFMNKPASISENTRREVLEEAGIYVYKFGELTCSRVMPYESRNNEENKKNLVGVIKKDEFGALRNYAILMNDISNYISPEFCIDVLFSDMLLRNAKNNMGYLGVPRRELIDDKYDWRINFDEPGINELLSAIHFENEPSKVMVTSNFKRAKSVSDALAIMEEKMEQAVEEIFEKKRRSQFDRGIGDDF